MKLFFKPEDFKIDGFVNTPSENARIANDKLEREGKIVYSNEAAFTWRLSDESKDHRALLINIEKISPCEHPKEKVELVCWEKGDFKDEEYKIFKCECGAKVEPSEFKEVK